MPKAPRRVTITFTPEAEQQVRDLERKDAERLDQALAVLSTEPTLGTPLQSAPALRDYRHESGVRLVYYATVLGSIIIVAYLET